MMRALYTAASGMEAQQFNLDTISNNLANVNTAGFRKNQARFQDLIYQSLHGAGTPSAGSPGGVSQEVGLGVKIGASEKQFSQGVLRSTGNPLDLAIQGEGLFQVTLPDGTTAYTRDGTFKVDANGNIVTANGYLLSPAVKIDATAISVSVSPDGAITAQIPGQTTPQLQGQISIARFQNFAGLAPQGSNLFLETGNSGKPSVANPGANGFGTVQGGYVEASNVSVVEEIVNMITTQRAFEANSKAVTVADEMLQTAVNTKR